MRPAALVVIVAMATPAHADSGEHGPETLPPAAGEPRAAPPPTARREPSASDVDGAPLPGAESGRLDRVDTPDSAGRVIVRGVLFVPKLLAELGFAPIRATAYLVDRYEIDDLYYRVFFNRDRTFGIVPTVGFEAGFGVTGITGGGRLVDRDLFGAHEHLAAQVAFGTAYSRQLYYANLRSGDRLGKRFSLELDGGYEVRPRDPFFGIGDGSTQKTPPGFLIDPTTDPLAIPTHFRQDRARVALIADDRVWRSLHVRGAAAYTDVSFGRGATGISTDDVYDPKTLVGFMSGVSFVYGEGELRWDSRRAVSPSDPRSLYNGGTLLAAFSGRVHRLDPGVDYWRYGVDAEHFFKLGPGPRVLSLRFHGEAVSGSRDEVPFTELPRIGGALMLRGYDLDRFRDRVAALATAEYQWDLSPDISAALFVDGGRVYPSLDQLSLAQMRLGYGAALELHSQASFVAEFSIASSIDGGMFLSLALNPVWDIDERARRTR